MEGWQNIAATPQDIAAWTAGGFSDGGVGIKAAHFPAIDIDVLDPDVAEQVDQWVADNIPGAPLVRYGQRPKRLLMFRTDEPFRKVQSQTFEDADGRSHKVEVLADGQQYVAYHIHPDTGAPYEWPNAGPADLPPESLPVLTADQAVALVRWFEDNVPFDWVPKTRRKDHSAATVDRSDPLAGVAPKTDLTPRQVQICLDEIADQVDDYQTWVEVGQALHHQFDGSTEGLDLWDTWSAEGAKYDAKAIAPKWRSFATYHDGGVVTFASVIQLAKDARKARKRDKVRKVGFPLIPAGEIRDKLGPIDWLIEGLVENHTVGALFGDPGTFKSFLAIDWACHVAAGRAWNGRPVRQGPVVYIAGEGHGGFARRLAAWEGQHGLSVADMPLWFSQHAAAFLDDDSAELVAEAVLAVSESVGPPALVVVDTLARNFGPGDESSNADMGQFINRLSDTLQTQGHASTVLVVHHTGHSDKKRARGAMALHAGVDFEYRVERLAEGAPLLKVSSAKMKDAPEPAAFGLEAVERTVGDADFEASSVVLIPASLDVERVQVRPTGQAGDLLTLVEREGPVRRGTLRDLALSEGVCDKVVSLRSALKRLRDSGWITCSQEEGAAPNDDDLFDIVQVTS